MDVMREHVSAISKSDQLQSENDFLGKKYKTQVDNAANSLVNLSKTVLGDAYTTQNVMPRIETYRKTAMGSGIQPIMSDFSDVIVDISNKMGSLMHSSRVHHITKDVSGANASIFGSTPPTVEEWNSKSDLERLFAISSMLYDNSIATAKAASTTMPPASQQRPTAQPPAPGRTGGGSYASPFQVASRHAPASFADMMDFMLKRKAAMDLGSSDLGRGMDSAQTPAPTTPAVATQPATTTPPVAVASQPPPSAAAVPPPQQAYADPRAVVSSNPPLPLASEAGQHRRESLAEAWTRTINQRPAPGGLLLATYNEVSNGGRDPPPTMTGGGGEGSNKRQRLDVRVQ